MSGICNFQRRSTGDCVFQVRNLALLSVRLAGNRVLEVSLWPVSSTTSSGVSEQKHCGSKCREQTGQEKKCQHLSVIRPTPEIFGSSMTTH
jgi:hypothetical protein